MSYIVWNGCDGYVETEEAKGRGHDFDGTLLYHGSLAFKPIEVVEIDPKELPTDEEGEPILDGVLGTETGHFYKAATPQNTEKTRESSVPEGATDFTDDGFRVTYYRRCQAFNMNLLEKFDGANWKMCSYLPWSELKPLPINESAITVESGNPEYFATFNHGENGRGGTLKLHATNDEQAKAEVRQFVGQGYRNETRAGVDLSNGTHYQAWNEHGEVKSRTLQGVDISFSPTTKAKEPKATVKSKGPDLLPTQLVVLNKERAKVQLGKAFYLRIAEENGAVKIVDLDGAITPTEARKIACEKGYNPSHWMESTDTLPWAYDPPPSTKPKVKSKGPGMGM